MKTKNFAFTAMAIFIAAAVSATELPALNVTPTTDKKVQMKFEIPKPAVVELSLKNSLGEVLYIKKPETPVKELQMIFDFRNASYGNYEVSVDYNNCKIKRKFTIENNRLVKIGKEECAFDPYCTFENNLLKITYLNNYLNNFYMKINYKGKYISEKKIGKDMCIQKIFDLSKLEKGQYEIVLSNRNDDYRFIVNK